MKKLIALLFALFLVINFAEANNGPRRCNLSHKQRHEMNQRRKQHRSTFGSARRNIFGRIPKMKCPKGLTCYPEKG